MTIPRVSYFLTFFTIAVLAACSQGGGHKEIISTKNAPAAIGPYSQGVRAGNTLYLSGQIAIDQKTNQIIATESIEEQTKRVIENLRAILEANNMTLADVVSTQVFMKDLNEYPGMNAIYATYFRENPPARATVEVARLPRDAKIEISAVAVKMRSSNQAN